MKNILFLFGMLCFFSCSPSKKLSQQEPIKKDQPKVVSTLYHISQSNNAIPLKKGTQNLKLKKEVFSLTFPLQIYNPDLELFYAIKLVLSEDPLPEAKLGVDSKTSLSLGPASGLATAGKYETYYITEGCHYIMFYPENAERCVKVKDLEEGKIQGQVEIKHINFNGKDYPIAELPLEALTLTLFNDENLNGFIDDAELYVLDIEF